MIVVADAGPLHYLTLIGHAEILAALFGVVAVPRWVVNVELADDATPPLVKALLNNPPGWLVLHDDLPSVDPVLAGLGGGERMALSLCLQLNARLLLCDDLAARKKAKALGIGVIGTLGLIEEASVRQYINFQTAIDQLTTLTNFRHSPELIDRLHQSYLRRISQPFLPSN